MKLVGKVKPISHLQAHAPDVIRAVAEDRQPVVITLDGEATAVLQDIESFEQTQETLALLKILALTNKAVDEGRVSPAGDAFERIRASVKN